MLLLGEMTDSKTETESVQDKPSVSIVPERSKINKVNKPINRKYKTDDTAE